MFQRSIYLIMSICCMHEQRLASSVIWLGQCICPTRPCGHAQPNVSRPGFATSLFMRGPVNKKPIRVALASCRKLRTNLYAVLKVWMETTPPPPPPPPPTKLPERIPYSLLTILIARCRKRDYMTYGKDAIQQRETTCVWLTIALRAAHPDR